MSEGATQRTRTGPRSLISRQLIRAALRALINGPIELGAASGRDGVSCAGSTPVLAWGAVPAEAPRTGPGLWPAGSGKCHLGPPREVRVPSRGTPRRGVWGIGGPSAKQLGDGMAHHFGPGMGYFLLEFWCAVVLADWQHRSSEGEGG